jgi:hypothetical protein
MALRCCRTDHYNNYLGDVFLGTLVFFNKNSRSHSKYLGAYASKMVAL